MPDNKVRLSKDVLEKAELIAREWGLKNARAAVEAVFRRYSDEYLQRRGLPTEELSTSIPNVINKTSAQETNVQTDQGTGCEALDELDDLLGI